MFGLDVPKDRIGRCILEGCGKHGSKGYSDRDLVQED